MKIHRYPQQRRRLRPVRILAGMLVIILFGAVCWNFFSGEERGQENGTTALPEKGEPLPQSILERVLPLPSSVEYPEGPLAEKQRFDRLVVKKAERRLYAYTHDKVARVYAIALGRQPKGPKEEQGDGKTPEGIYAVREKIESSPYYKSLVISYPNAADLARVAETGKSPGGVVSIHGLPKDYAFLEGEHRASDWTHGCVAVSNKEMDELFKHTPAGTPVEFLP